MRIQSVVIGGGPGGLGAAAELRRRGIQVLVIDQASELGSTWRSAYDRVHLNTVAWVSHLPGRRVPWSAGRWPTRDAYLAYLEQYARERRLDIRLGVTAERVDREREGWRVVTDEDDILADQVVVATGHCDVPTIPAWPGRDAFTGRLIHSSEYRNAAPWAGRRALVVGAGNSGAEIAVDLADAGADVLLSIRTPPHVVAPEVGPVPSQLVGIALRYVPVGLVDRFVASRSSAAFGDLTELGLEHPSEGVATRHRRDAAIPIVDFGFVHALRRRLIGPVAGVAALEPTGAVLADGRHVEADVIVAATGFRTRLADLVGHLGVVDDRGLPIVHGARTHPDAPGLRFIGFTNPLTGNLREMRLDARRIGRAAARQAGVASRREPRRAPASSMAA
jgi:putative flavoprotein involved in K+ transport